MKTTLRALLLALGLHSLPLAATDPATPVRELLVALQGAQPLDCAARERAVAAAIATRFDWAFIARFTLGRHGRELSAEQLANWQTTLRELSAAHFARYFRIDQVPQLLTESRDPPQARVRARLGPGAEDELVFLLRPDGQDWRIANIIAGGVSDLALRAAQYRQLLAQRGYTALLEHVRRQRRETLRACED